MLSVEEKYHLLCQSNTPVKKAALGFLGIRERTLCPTPKADCSDSLTVGSTSGHTQL